MPLAFLMDHCVPAAITEGLRLRQVEILTAYEDDSHRLDDPELLDRATELGRPLFSMDTDLLQEAVRRQRAGIDFAGVVYAHQRRCSIGRCIEDLELIAKTMDPEELRGIVEYLPL